MSYLSLRGLEYQGLVIGALHSERLYLITNTGTREYYFFKYKRQVEHLFASLKMR